MTAGSITVADKINTWGDVLIINGTHVLYPWATSEVMIKEWRMIFKLHRQVFQLKKRNKAKSVHACWTRERWLILKETTNVHTNEYQGHNISILTVHIWCMLSCSWTHINLHINTHTEYPGVQQDKPALVVPGLFDFWDEMSEQSTLRHYTTDVYEYVCLHRNAHLWVPSLLLHTKDKTLISEKYWNSSTTSAEQLNQRQQFHWRRREEKKGDKDRERKEVVVVVVGCWARDQSRSCKKETQHCLCESCHYTAGLDYGATAENRVHLPLTWLAHSVLNTNKKRPTHLCATSKESSLPVFSLVCC